MVAHKISAAEHQLRGTYRKDRHAARKPDHGGIGEPPKHLDTAHALVWKELVASLPKDLGVHSDRAGFELLVRLTAKMRSGKAKSADTTQLRLLLESFALTPSGRQRLAVETPKPKVPSALDEFGA